MNKNHNVLGSLTHVYGPTFTSQTKVVWNRLLGDQPLNGDPQPTLYMNPTGVARLQGFRIGFPGYLPFSPGSAIPFGGPQSLLQLYQDQTWIKGSHDLRFGGSYVHMSDERTFGAYANAVESLNTTNAVLPSLDNFVLGQIRQFQTAINPQGFPGGTYVTPVSLPSFTSFNKYNEFALYANDNWSLRNRITLNLGVRYEYYGPQTKSEPKYDSNFYYGDPNVSVTRRARPPTSCAESRPGSVMTSAESPVGALWKSDKNNFAPRLGFAWDVTGDGRTSVRAGYGMAFERNFGNVTYNVLFNPPQYLVATINAPEDVATLPIYTDPAGPFGGVAGVTKTIPAGSLRHIDQNIETAYAHFYSGSFQRELGPAWWAASSTRVRAAGSCTTWRIPTSAARHWSTSASGGPTTRPNPRYRGVQHPRQPWSVAVSRRHLRDRCAPGWTDRPADDREVHARPRERQSEQHVLRGLQREFQPRLSRCVRSDAGLRLGRVRRPAPPHAVRGVGSAVCRRTPAGLAKALAADWQLSWLLTARTGYPFTVYDCTNGCRLCMRAEDPDGIDRNATGGDSTGNPNEFNLLDLTPLVAHAGGYVHPLTGNSDFGPYPDDMLERNAFRGPGFWNVDFILSKRVRFGTRAVQFRGEAYNLFNHANMYPRADTADVSAHRFHRWLQGWQPTHAARREVRVLS